MSTTTSCLASDYDRIPYDSLRETWMALSMLAVGLSGVPFLTRTSCEEEIHEDGNEDDDNDFEVFSSSDPMDLPTLSDDGVPLERILLTDITPPSKEKEWKDAKSDFSKSVRAFGSGLETTAALRRRDTPLATTSNHQDDSNNETTEAATTTTAQDRISSLDQHDNETVTTKNVYFYKASQIHRGMMEKFVLLAGPSSEDLGGDIAHLLGVGVNRATIGKFADG